MDPSVHRISLLQTLHLEDVLFPYLQESRS
jgi:hypothetical protein